jgi:hypothetical protein
MCVFRLRCMYVSTFAKKSRVNTLSYICSCWGCAYYKHRIVAAPAGDCAITEDAVTSRLGPGLVK